jgi:hypothetical protein
MSVHLHILVEGSSEKALLDGWLPRFLPGVGASIIVHRGKGRIPFNPAGQPDMRKHGLLDQLPAKLRAYSNTLDASSNAVVVLLDADDDNCVALKQQLTALARTLDIAIPVAFCIAVEETEAFYLGDWNAIKAAFPNASTSDYRAYRQDSICGTWERFSDLVEARMTDKVGWATTMGRHLSASWPPTNRSQSFQYLCRQLRRLAGPDASSENTPRPDSGATVKAPRRSRRAR